MNRQKHNLFGGIIKQSLTVFTLMVAALSLTSFIPGVFAQGLIGADDNIDNVKLATGNADSASELIRTIVNYFLFFLGLIATIMVIGGGVMLVTGAGEQEKVDKGKKMITFALVGIIVILLSFVLVKTVIDSGLGSEATT